jgi:hypothetical protein
VLNVLAAHSLGAEEKLSSMIGGPCKLGNVEISIMCELILNLKSFHFNYLDKNLNTFDL